MSKLLLKQLNFIKPLLKPKGLVFEKFGVVKNGYLHFNNGYIEVKTPIDIPFDTCVDLTQLHTLLSSFKTETVIVNKDGVFCVTCGNNDYVVPTQSIDSLDTYIKYFNCDEFSENLDYSDLKSALSISESIVRQIDCVITFTDCLFIKDNSGFCTDNKNIMQYVFNNKIPDCALTLPTIVYFNKMIKKYEITNVGYIQDNLVLKLNESCQVFLNCVKNDNPERISNYTSNFNKLKNGIDKYWQQPDTYIPTHVLPQLKMCHKLSKNNIAFFNNSFCECGDVKIQYENFGDKPFSFKAPYKFLELVLSNANWVKSGDTGLSFIADNGCFRGVIGKMIEAKNA